MSAYWPPLENLPTFDVLVFRQAQDVVEYAVASGTSNNIANGTAGELLYQSAPSTTAKLPIGTNTFILTSNGSAPVWTAPPVIPGTPTLSAVLLAGNSAGATNIDMNTQSITNANNITATTFNGTLNGTANIALRANTIDTTTLPGASAFYYLNYVDTSTGATSRIVYTNSSFYFNPASGILAGATINLFGGFSNVSTTASSRVINNTFYNLMDNTAVAGGTNRGNLTTTSTVASLNLTSATHRFTITNNSGALTPFLIDPADLTIITTNNPTISGFTSPASSDSSSKIATTAWVQSAITAGTSGTATNANNIFLTVDNTATVYYPTFAATGAGYQPLLYDTTVSPLSYQPSTSTLTATNFSGLASQATQIKTTSDATNATQFLTFSASNTSSIVDLRTDAGIACNPFLNSITATTFNGNLNGTAGSFVTTETPSLVYWLVGSTSQTTSTDTTLYKSNVGNGVYVNAATNVLISEGLGVNNSIGDNFTIKFDTPTGDDFIFVNNGLVAPAGNRTLFKNIDSSGITRTVLTLDGNAGASTFDGLSAASTTVAVADNNTATTMYPVFTTTGAGQKSLLFDSSTTPLRYKPDTSELSALQFTVNGLNSVAGDNAGFLAQNIGSSATTIQNQATSGRIHLAVRNASNILSNALIITSDDASGTQFSVGNIVNPVAGDNAGFFAQNIGSSATVIQNQATSGLIQLITRNALSNAINTFQLSTTDLTITTTNNPTITGFTAPATTDNTAKIATTSWVQSALTSGVATATTVNVQVNNTATTMYPIFATTGAGQKSLLFDTTTTALSYTPSTSTLRAFVFSIDALGRYELPTTIASSITGLGTDIVIDNTNVGGSIDFKIATSGLPLTFFEVSEASTVMRNPTFITSFTSGASATKALQIKESAGVGISMLSNAGSGAYNALVVVNDSVILGDNAAINTSDLVLTTWSATTAGVRITPTSALIGAGGTTATPTSSVSCSGTTVTVTGDPVVTNRNIQVDNGSGVPITIGNGASTATSNIIMTSGSLASTRDFTTGENVIIGNVAGNSLAVASNRNTLVGDAAGSSATGNNNICIGYNSQVPTAASNNQIAIGTATETMYIQGGFNWRVGTQITNSTNGNLSAAVLAQFYTVAMTAASQTILLPTPTTAAYRGARVTFKRKTNVTVFTITAGAGTPFIPINSITAALSISVAATVFQVDLVCDGVNWCSIGQA